jgi:3-methyladenine DNA glycosylase/8-oxoguanine DNA glycosylase
VFRDGVLEALLPAGGGVERAAAQQLPDGSLRLVAQSVESILALRFTLGIDADHADFLRRFRDDALLGPATRALAGLRPLRVPTVAQALLRALCGQLIESSRARFLERRIVRATMPAVGRLHAPPTAAALAALAPAELRRLGLHARRGATLVRVCTSLDLERLRNLPPATVSERLGRERGLGPWSIGVIALEGLGRFDLGLVGDLGLIKLLSRLRGRRVESWETEELLAPYGEWAGLASVYLLAAWGRGLLPVSPAARFAA